MQYNGAKRVFSTNDAGPTRHPHAKNLNVVLTPFIKINSKQITDLKIIYKTVKLLEDNLEEKEMTFVLVITFLIKHQKHNPLKK